VLAEVGIEAFLAHDDLHVSDEWRARIIEELKRCDIFVPLLSASFIDSKWAPQEVGFIISRPEIAIAPISLDGTTPFGFISHVQSRNITSEGITRELLVEPLARRMPRAVLPGLIEITGKAGSFRTAEASWLLWLSILRSSPPPKRKRSLPRLSRTDRFGWPTCARPNTCRNYSHHQAKNIDPKTLRALNYQIEHGEWYKGD